MRRKKVAKTDKHNKQLWKQEKDLKKWKLKLSIDFSLKHLFNEMRAVRSVKKTQKE